METQKKQKSPPLQSSGLFFSADLLHRCSPTTESTCFGALMRKLCLSSSELLEACSAASCLLPSSPLVGDEDSASFCRSRSMLRPLPRSCTRSFVPRRRRWFIYLILFFMKKKNRIMATASSWCSLVVWSGWRGPVVQAKRVWRADTLRNLLHNLQAHLAAALEKKKMLRVVAGKSAANVLSHFSKSALCCPLLLLRDFTDSKTSFREQLDGPVCKSNIFN